MEKLNKNDFSVEDRAKADELLNKMKLKIEMKKNMSSKHSHIDQLTGRSGIRSLME
jgi:hypothetical protein